MARRGRRRSPTRPLGAWERTPVIAAASREDGSSERTAFVAALATNDEEQHWRHTAGSSPQQARDAPLLLCARGSSKQKPEFDLEAGVGRRGSWRTVPCMATFVLRLIAPRPNFAQTLTDSEREIMNRHAAHWRPHLERGDMVVFGPVLTDEGSYGLAVVETDDEQALREFAAQDPVVMTGTAAFEFGRMAASHVRGR